MTRATGRDPERRGRIWLTAVVSAAWVAVLVLDSHVGSSPEVKDIFFGIPSIGYVVFITIMTRREVRRERGYARPGGPPK